MKTITANFQFQDGQTATATGNFETLPGEGPVEWEGHTAPILAFLAGLPEHFRKLPEMGYSAGFAGAMQGLAARCHAHISISESGDWEINEE